MSEYERSQQNLDEIERLLRKPGHSRNVETKIPLKDPSKYTKLWFTNQEDQDAYDSLMRKKIYFQNNYGEKGDKEFTLNGFKTTFGMFTKEFKERRFEESEVFKKQNAYLKEVLNRPDLFEKALPRYHGYTDYDYERQFRWNTYKSALFILALRELPLVHFYARAFIMSLGLGLVVIKSWKYFNSRDKPIYGMHWRSVNDFANFPLLAELVLKTVVPKNLNPAATEADVWWYFQGPVFYHHHFKHYRYVFRNRRVVPWDGTFNQPILPYFRHGMNNRGEFVHNGTLEETEPKGSGNF